MTATYKLSAFGDEIADDLAEQLRVLREIHVNYLELRGAWGKNVLHFSDPEVARVKAMCTEQGITVSAIGSPVGKSPLADPIEKEVANLERLIQIAHALELGSIRVFSFYPPDANLDQHVARSADYLSRLAELAQREGVQLVLENEKGIVGDTVARCHQLLTRVENPHLRFAWDPANFVQVGEATVTEEGWPLLGSYTTYVHVKDALVTDGSVRAAGQGDGQVGELLDRLNQANYQGFLALEPHLAIAGHSSGFSGPDGMAFAVQTLRDLMVVHGCTEIW